MLYTHPASGTVEDPTYTYDENSNRTSETSVLGLSSTVFDLRNQLIQATYPAAPGGNPAIEEFRYDDAGNRLERRHTHGPIFSHTTPAGHSPVKVVSCPGPNSNGSEFQTVESVLCNLIHRVAIDPLKLVLNFLFRETSPRGPHKSAEKVLVMTLDGSTLASSLDQATV